MPFSILTAPIVTLVLTGIAASCQVKAEIHRAPSTTYCQSLFRLSSKQVTPARVQLKATISGHTKRIISIDFSPDGGTIATASQDGTVRLWDANTGKTKAHPPNREQSLLDPGRVESGWS